MKLSEVIGASATLYHGTSIESLTAIVASGSIRASQVDKGPAGVSLSRDPRVAHEKAALRGRNHGGGAILAFDRNQLRQHFGKRLRPIDVLNIRGNQPDNPYSGSSEAEERFAGELPTAFIAGIVLTDPAATHAFQIQHPKAQTSFDFINARIFK